MNQIRVAGLFASTMLLAHSSLAPTVVAQELTPITVVLGYIADVESYGAIYAKEMGYFAEEGLDVTVVPAGQGVDQIQMVSANIAQLGIVGPENILAATEQGGSFKVIAAEFQRTPVAMTCRKDSGVETPADLVGKRIGVKTSGAAPYNDLFLAKNGISKEQVEITPIGIADISLLIAGRIDCMVTTFAFNEPMLIEQAGVPVNVLSLGDYGMNSQVNSYFVTDEYYSDPANREILTKYMRAELRAWDEFFKDPAAAAKFMIDGQFYDGLELTQQTYQAEQQVEYMRSPLTAERGIFALDPSVWEETAQNAVAAGVTKEVIDVSNLLVTDILDAANPPKH